jgi:hypothetical protein
MTDYQGAIDHRVTTIDSGGCGPMSSDHSVAVSWRAIVLGQLQDKQMDRCSPEEA